MVLDLDCRPGICRSASLHSWISRIRPARLLLLGNLSADERIAAIGTEVGFPPPADTVLRLASAAAAAPIVVNTVIWPPVLLIEERLPSNAMAG